MAFNFLAVCILTFSPFFCAGSSLFEEPAGTAQGSPLFGPAQDKPQESKPTENGIDNQACVEEAGGPEPQSVSDVRLMIKTNWTTLQKAFEKDGITVDVKSRRVDVKGVIIRDKQSAQYPIEYVVVSEGGNTHEALILIKAKPSNINAALLSIGLEPGKTVSYKKRDPPPTQEEVDSGRETLYEVVPPKGRAVYIYVKYNGWAERPIRFLEDLILDLRTGQPLERAGWVYVGSRFAEVLLGRDRVVKYMADMERNVVACYLTGFGNAIFDINSADGINDALFDANREETPPMGSKITLIFSINPL